MFLPFILLSAISLITAYKKFTQRIRSHVSLSTVFVEKFFEFYSFASVVMFTSVIYTSLSPLQCYQVGESDTYFMYKNPSMECYDGRWNFHLPLVCIFVVLYCFALPLSCAAVFARNRHNIQEEWFVRRYGSMIRRYRPWFFWWEFVVMLKKLIFVVSLHYLVLSNNGSANFFVSICVLLIETSCLACQSNFTSTIDVVRISLFFST